VTVSDSDLKFNSARDGGGIYNWEGNLEVTDSQLVANTAMLRGGGIYNNQGAVGLTGSQLITNGAALGGGLYNDSPFGTVVIGTTLFQLNTSDNISGPYFDVGGNTFI
jgi:hypothetical protein